MSPEPMSNVKLVVVNSFGPMGASLLAALIEKWGYLNLPMRGREVLVDYLLGRRDLSDPKIKDRFKSSFFQGTLYRSRGGTSVVERDSNRKNQLIDGSLATEKLEVLDARPFKTLPELYDAYRSLYAECVCYKTINSVPSWHIELATDYASYGGKDLEAAFRQHFDHVVFFHLTRDLYEWLEATASQYMAHADGGTVFRLGQAIEQYEAYMDSIMRLPGVKIDFSDLVFPKLGPTLNLISIALDAPVRVTSLESEYFDVYGGMFTYENAFTKKDQPGRYFSWLSRGMMRFIKKLPIRARSRSLIFHPFYLFESYRNRKLRSPV